MSARVEKGYQRLWETSAAATLPWLMVRFPDAGDKAAPLWAGPVAEDTLTALVESPVRQKMAQCLTHGDAAVFLLLTSGISEADAAAEAMVRGELGRLQDKIKLPEQSRDGPQLLFDLPLKVSFPLVTVSRKSAAERYLVQMLLRGEEDLSRVKGPILFPIFGRGRILSSFHGEDLSADQVGTVARFLCGACSCQVKEANPGVDMLFACAWEERLAAAAEALAGDGVEKIGAPAAEESPRTTHADLAASNLPSIGPLETHAEDNDVRPASRRRTWLWCAIALAAALVLVTGSWVLRSTRPGSDTGPGSLPQS